MRLRGVGIAVRLSGWHSCPVGPLLFNIDKSTLEIRVLSVRKAQRVRCFLQPLVTDSPVGVTGSPRPFAKGAVRGAPQLSRTATGPQDRPSERTERRRRDRI